MKNNTSKEIKNKNTDIAASHFIEKYGQSIYSLIKKYNNDSDLGKNLRDLYFKSLDYAYEVTETNK